MDTSEQAEQPKTRANMEIGKIPPQAREVEEMVLGACMLESNAIPKALSFLSKESFYEPVNALIFDSINFLYSTGKPVDIITVTEHLRKYNKLDVVGGAYGVTELTKRIASGANVEHHAIIVAQKFIQREIIRLSSDAIRDSYDGTTDCLELLDGLIAKLIAVTSHITKNTAKHISKASTDNYKLTVL